MLVSIAEFEKVSQFLIASLRDRFGNEVSVDVDLYWRPEQISDFFKVDRELRAPAVGSLCDEMEFMRKSVLVDEDDLLDEVLLRYGFMLLAVAAKIEDG